MVVRVARIGWVGVVVVVRVAHWLVVVEKQNQVILAKCGCTGILGGTVGGTLLLDMAAY